MNKYEIRTANKKKAIINAALTLFSEKGFSSVSIKEIAALADVSQVSIYNYFNSKEALVTECVNIVMEEMLRNASDLLSKKMDFKEKLLNALSLCTNSINQSIYNYFSPEALRDTVLLNLLTESINQQKMEVYRNYIELGKQEGVINHSISTSTILEFMEAINIVGSKIPPSELKTKELELHQLFLYGIMSSDIIPVPSAASAHNRNEVTIPCELGNMV